MNKIKIIGVFSILVIITFCIVFIPQFISGQNEGNLLNKTIYRNYNIGSRAKVTSEQVARFYCDQEIIIGYNTSHINNENSDTSAIRKDVKDLVELIFKENESICKQINNMLTDSFVDYSRNSNLIKVGNQPIALNFILVSIKKDGTALEILYEEKTKTIISFSYDALETRFDINKNADRFFKKIDSLIRDYYESQLKLNTEEYYSIGEFENKITSDEGVIFENGYINFGIVQPVTDDEVKKESFIHY